LSVFECKFFIVLYCIVLYGWHRVQRITSATAAAATGHSLPIIQLVLTI